MEKTYETCKRHVIEAIEDFSAFFTGFSTKPRDLEDKVSRYSLEDTDSKKGVAPRSNLHAKINLLTDINVRLEIHLSARAYKEIRSIISPISKIPHMKNLYEWLYREFMDVSVEDPKTVAIFKAKVDKKLLAMWAMNIKS